jgi:hypothetical protein
MRRALAVIVTAGQTASSARVVLCILLIIGSTCAIVAVFMLGGTAPALLTASTICFVLAYLILRGLAPNV